MNDRLNHVEVSEVADGLNGDQGDVLDFSKSLIREGDPDVGKGRVDVVFAKRNVAREEAEHTGSVDPDGTGSLRAIDARRDHLAAELVEIASRQKQEVAKIKADSNLSRVGKTVQIEQIETQAQAAIEKVAEESEAAVTRIADPYEANQLAILRAEREASEVDASLSALQVLTFAISAASLASADYAQAVKRVVSSAVPWAGDVVQAANIRLGSESDRLHMQEIVQHARSTARQRAQERIARDPKKLHAAAKLVALDERLADFRRAKEMASHPQDADLILANR